MTIAAAELRGLVKDFPGVRALNDVSLAIRPGEVLGLVGENGAGKSTLIKILGGVYATGSFRGDVLVGGKPQTFRSTRDARRAGVAVVHQELSLVPAMTVAENLLLGREPTRLGVVDGLAMLAIARDLLREILGDDAAAASLGSAEARSNAKRCAGSIDLTTPVGQLGVGVQQVLEIARALGERARVIVLDEPTAALDDGEIERLFALVRARRAAGASFIYISHRLDEIRALCDRVAVMRDGQLVAIHDATIPTEQIVALMTGKELEAPARTRTIDTAAAPVLEVEHLTIAHPQLAGRRVVDDLSFTVRAGEVVALAGAMGSGRSATLAALFGAARSACTGTVRVDGRAIGGNSPSRAGAAAIGRRSASHIGTTPRGGSYASHRGGGDSFPRTPADAIAAGIALVPEDRKGQGLVLGLSVADNLGICALGHHSRAGIVDAAVAERAAHTRSRDLAIKAPGLGAEVATLSGGNQQKVVIGKWLELAPRVLLLDEPTRGVDVGAKAEIYRLVEDLVARGHAVVLASSDLPEILRLADRVLVLREGRLAGSLAGDAITAHAIMQLAVGSASASAADAAADAPTAPDAASGPDTASGVAAAPIATVSASDAAAAPEAAATNAGVVP